MTQGKRMVIWKRVGRLALGDSGISGNQWTLPPQVSEGAGPSHQVPNGCRRQATAVEESIRWPTFLAIFSRNSLRGLEFGITWPDSFHQFLAIFTDLSAIRVLFRKTSIQLNTERFLRRFITLDCESGENYIFYCSACSQRGDFHWATNTEP